MAQTNTRNRNQLKTHEGAPAKMIGAEAQLRRSVMSCLLFEDEFYEDGVKIADRISGLVKQLDADTVSQIALEARGKHNLRHAPLWIARCLAREHNGPIVGDTIAGVIQRADELTEFLSLYWLDKRQPLSAQVKRGLSIALTKFDGYQLAKYNRDKSVKLRDVLRLVHPKPATPKEEKLWGSVLDGSIASPDTWEVALSAGEDKKATWERLLSEGQLGYLALLRNLRNMDKVGVDDDLIRQAIIVRKGARRVLPFRYVAAARAAPRFEPQIDTALCAAIAEMPVLSGETIVLVDVSASMDASLSYRSDMRRMDAAAALASIISGEKIRVMTFSRNVVEVPPRRGMAGVDAVIKSQPHGMTDLGGAVRHANNRAHDRLIVITDEQSHTEVPDPVAPDAYMINVASNENGVGYGRWTHIDGFSESVIRFIHEYEGVASD